MALHNLSGRQIAHGGFKPFITLCVFISPIFAAGAAPQEVTATCEVQTQSVESGKFSTALVDEASGLALSSDGQNFYVINDSGDQPRFFRTKLDGTRIEEFRVKESLAIDAKEWKARDPEDLAVGPCPKDIGGECIVLADIGDNRANRKSIELIFIRTADLPGAGGASTTVPVTVAIAKRLKLKYPDRAHDAESFAVLNARYGLIITKEQDRKTRESKPAGVFVVDFDTALIAQVGKWDVPGWVKDQGLRGLVTSAAATAGTSPGSVRVLMLTYGDAMEVVASTDIMTKPAWPPRPWSVRSRAILKIDPLVQQEAVTFDRGYTGFYYTTEAPLAMLGLKTAAIRWVEKMACP